MWSFIEQEIAQQLDRPIKLTDMTPQSGGDSHRAYRLETDAGDNYFIKINDALFYPSFLAEAHALKKIGRCDALKVPAVIACSQVDKYSFLLLEFLTFTPLNDSSWRAAGCQLAKLHKTDIQAKFGFDDDNYIGRTVQSNQWSSNWSTFFSEQRIGFQLEQLAEKSIHLGDIDDLVACIHSHLKAHQPDACLLHGDLWSGNLAAVNNQPVVYDPASYYGDRETDIAMTHLFGGFADSFYQAYQAAWPLPKGALKRQQIYNLYHILNHANLFGGSYLLQARQAVRQLTPL